MTSEFLPEPIDPQAAVERDSRIEELLLEGLDYYFARQYERAITVWTRVAFLERGHGRARAYIERARSAQAEQQRQSEELLHAGVAAYHAGELQAARDLLTRAVEGGGPHEMALVYLERLGRVEAVPRPIREGTAAPDRSQGHGPVAARRVSPGWMPTAVGSAAVVLVVVLLSLLVRSYLVRQPTSAVTVAAPEGERRPVAGDAERRIARARAVYAGGRPHDALRLLDQVVAADERRPQADALRAEIQRALMAGVSGDSAGGEP